MTSDYQRHPMHKFDVIRKCDIAGTEEAENASQQKDKVKAWRGKQHFRSLISPSDEALVFGQSTKVRDSYVGKPMLGNGNRHRGQIAASIAAATARLGRNITLEDTYDEGRHVPGGNPFMDGPLSRG